MLPIDPEFVAVCDHLIAPDQLITQMRLNQEFLAAFSQSDVSKIGIGPREAMLARNPAARGEPAQTPQRLCAGVISISISARKGNSPS